MLGLGDIVIPGIFVALSLRYDYYVACCKSSTPSPNPRSSYPTPYFTSTLVAYIIGLTTTIVVMHSFKAAQPALLYLSPACVGAVALTAWARGEWRAVWGWEDGEEEREEEVQEKEKEGRLNIVERVVDGGLRKRGVVESDKEVKKRKGKKTTFEE